MENNIHVLPTDKPSRLYLNSENKIFITDVEMKCGNTQNIYITNDEEIKKGDWVIEYIFDNLIFKVYSTTSEFVKKSRFYSLPRNHCKKIILTTDQDLIKDGVQAIDDEFLEWFVKNPNCEEVETKLVQFEVDMGLGYSCVEQGSYYKIIIPKEEPKERLRKILGTKHPKQEINLEDIFNDDKKENIKKFIDEINNPSEPSQALKDAAERLKGKELFKESNDRARKILSEIKSLPIQERSYSEEDMILYSDYVADCRLLETYPILNPKEWFEQFKKK